MCYIFVGVVLLELSGNRIFGGVLRLVLKNVKKSSKILPSYISDLQVVNKSVEKFLKKSCKNIWWIRKKAATLHPQNRNVLYFKWQLFPMGGASCSLFLTGRFSTRK